ncbi:RDD family protein [Halobacillus massiliensis]|uniref:RDD family protein n=1 Tax=Halobacillus massiliensis TaxID=1926286 RepID=UPI0009E26A79|nr:RDD family protein [Halobacillus massiliensis]
MDDTIHEGLGDPAGFWKRAGGNIVDGLILSVAGFLLVDLVLMLNSNPPADNQPFSAADNIKTVIQLAYSIILPVVWAGYTVGKRALSIKITKFGSHEKVTFGTMVLRILVAGLVYAVSLGICFIISLFMVIFREDKRAIHDFIAGTQVREVR